MVDESLSLAMSIVKYLHSRSVLKDVLPVAVFRSDGLRIASLSDNATRHSITSLQRQAALSPTPHYKEVVRSPEVSANNRPFLPEHPIHRAADGAKRRWGSTNDGSHTTTHAASRVSEHLADPSCLFVGKERPTYCRLLALGLE